MLESIPFLIDPKEHYLSQAAPPDPKTVSPKANLVSPWWLGLHSSSLVLGSIHFCVHLSLCGTAFTFVSTFFSVSQCSRLCSLFPLCVAQCSLPCLFSLYVTVLFISVSTFPRSVHGWEGAQNEFICQGPCVMWPSHSYNSSLFNWMVFLIRPRHMVFSVSRRIYCFSVEEEAGGRACDTCCFPYCEYGTVQKRCSAPTPGSSQFSSSFSPHPVPVLVEPCDTHQVLVHSHLLWQCQQ